MAAPNDLPEVELDPKNLYREDVFTDRRAGSIRRLTPVTVDGAPDAARAVLFSGQTQLLTPAGVLPLGFEIEARTLEEALKKFPEGVKVAWSGLAAGLSMGFSLVGEALLEAHLPARPWRSRPGPEPCRSPQPQAAQSASA